MRIITLVQPRLTSLPETVYYINILSPDILTSINYRGCDGQQSCYCGVMEFC